MTAITRWISSKFLSSKSLRASDYVRPDGPTNCPICNGKIEQKSGSEEFVCIGLANREEVEKYMPDGKDTPAIVTEIPPCGWHGRADEYGKTWM